MRLWCWRYGTNASHAATPGTIAAADASRTFFTAETPLPGAFRLLPHQRRSLAEIAPERHHRRPGHQEVVVGKPGARQGQAEVSGEGEGQPDGLRGQPRPVHE